MVACRHHDGDIIGKGFLDQLLDSIPILWDRGQAIKAICRRMGKQDDRFPFPFIDNDVVESGSKGEVDVCYVEGRLDDYEVRVLGDACVPTLDGVEVSTFYLEQGRVRSSSWRVYSETQYSGQCHAKARLTRALEAVHEPWPWTDSSAVSLETEGAKCHSMG